VSSLALDHALRRDRAIVLTGLGALVAVAWLYLCRDAAGIEPAQMPAGVTMAMPAMATWTLTELLTLVAMWMVMMIAMMVPSAAPIVLMFTALERKQPIGAAPVGRAGLFLLGYLCVWTAFSVVAAAAQWALHAVALMSPMMMTTSPILGGLLLIAAGAFQWTPLKRACLATCRSPIGFLLGEWRDGRRGAVAMGLRHGAICLGCCWLLMALLFVAGVMNLLWVAAIAAFVLVEKAFPRGEAIARGAGVLLVVAGLLMLTRGSI
jgi:predicted metal-binding membrane protein